MENGNGDLLRGRIRQIYSFLQAVIQQKYAAPRRISEQPFRLQLTTLPDHESVIYTPEADFDLPILEVKRPRLVPCPRPCAELLPWLEKGWDLARPDTQVRSSRPTGQRDQAGNEVYESFEWDPVRVEQLDKWRRRRVVWMEERLRAEAAQRLFEQLYEQLTAIEKEGGTSELVVGDGLLNWRITSGGIEHPLLTKRVELLFDQTVPCFKIVNTDRPVELYNSFIDHPKQILPSATHLDVGFVDSLGS